MKTISQVASLTGVSTRTLQYYDEIGLLKPSETTKSGYRLYDDDALQALQQILFFKELDFKLKEIKDILEKPDFDRISAYHKQKELLSLKRKRMDELIALLDRLEKGESCMSFKEFDLSNYIEALEHFKCQNQDEVIKHWGSVDVFNKFIQKIKDDEKHVAELAIKQYGSVEKYTEAMKYNLEHFEELMNQSVANQRNANDIMEKNNSLYQKLTEDMTRDVSAPEVQEAVRQIEAFQLELTDGINMGDNYWDLVIDSYSKDICRDIVEEKYGKGAADYIPKALRYYFHKNET